MIDYDTASENVAAADPQTWTHTPVGTPLGVWVSVVHTTTTADIVVGVTYGGVALARTGTTTNPSALGRSYSYFLGSGIPTGAQTVSIDRTEATTSVHGVCVSLTAALGTEVIATGSQSANASNPSVALAYDSRTCIALAALLSGKNATTDLVEQTGVTRVHDHDFLAETAYVGRQTTPGSADFVIGWTGTSDQIALVAVAVTEVEGVGAGSDPVIPAGGSSVPRSPGYLRKALEACKTLPQLLKVLALELPRFAQAVTTYERVAVLAYGTTIRPSGDVSRYGQITVTNATPFTIANPISPREGVELTLDIYNSSGGAMGTITWGSEYQLAGTFVNPASTKHRSIGFYRRSDGKWAEMRRNQSDLS